MTAPGQAIQDHDQQNHQASPEPGQRNRPRPGQQPPAQATALPASRQQRAHHVLGDLLDAAAARNLPLIDWKLAASTAHLTGRCTAHSGPGRRRADFDAWTTMLGAQATEDTTPGHAVRLTARTERDNGLVTIEIIADLYDDLPAPLTTPAPSRNWRSP